MRPRSTRVAALLVPCLLLVTAQLGWGGAAQAAVGAYRPMVKKVALAAPTGLAATGAKLYVTDGNAVKIYSASTGSLITSVTGVFGATSPLAVPGRGVVLVAAGDGSAVKAISMSTNAVTLTGTTAACPRSLQVTADTLWYVGDCSAPFHVYTLPLDTLSGTATAVPGLSTSSSSITPMRINGSTLALAETLTVDTFTIAADNTVTPAQSIPVSSGDGEMALGPDSVYVANMANYNYRRYSLTDGSLIGSFDTGPYPGTLALTSDGAKLATGMNSPYNDGLFVFDTASGSTVVHAPADVSQGSYADITQVALSPDGSRLYALGEYWTGSASVGYLNYIFTATTKTPSRLSATVSAVSPRSYGKPLHLSSRVTKAGRPVRGAKVTFTISSNGRTRKVSATTSRTGVAHASVSVSYSGTVQATVKGNLTTIGDTSRSTRFTAPSRMRIVMSKARSVSGGIHYYSSVSAVRSAMKLLPTHYGATINVQLQALSGGSWRTTATTTLSTNAESLVGVQLLSCQRNVVHRFVFSFAGDSYSRATRGSSDRFVVR